MYEPVDSTISRKSGLANWRWLALVLVGLIIFGGGYSLGQGKFSLGRVTRSQNKQLPNSLDYSAVDEVYHSLKDNFDGQLDGNKLNQGLKAGLAHATGDPYTEYFTAAEYKDFDEGLTGNFTGIGAELGKEDNAIVIVAPIAGFPADKAGLKPKDIITEINGKNAYDLTISEAVKLIRGPKGTVVKLKIVRNQRDEKTFDIERDNISIPSVQSQVDNGIGYIKISRFGDDTANLARQAAKTFKDNNVKGVVLDLRSDPGGLLDAAVDVSSLWLPAGKQILSERRGGVPVKAFESNGQATLAGIPTAVLINEGSASASEITAGALKDNGVASLIGQKSYGKGSVQQLERLQDGSVLKVTIARWYTPNGKNIDKAGIEPDTKVALSDDDAKAGRDPQKDAAYAAVNK